MHTAASIPVGAAVSLLIVAIFLVVAISIVLSAARDDDEALADVVSLERYRQQRDAMRATADPSHPAV